MSQPISARYRHALPQLEGSPFITDGGLETTLVFLDGVDLPAFAAYPLLGSSEGRARLRRYFEPYLKLAAEHGTGFVLDTATWRANADWGAQLGDDALALAAANRDAVRFAMTLREEAGAGSRHIVINGVIGPRGDGYRPEALMTPAEARSYHISQIVSFRDAGADMVSAITMNYEAEALGIVQAAQAAGMPVVVSFTVETDGKLPTGQSLREVIEAVDRASQGAPAYYMINCAHPAHFGEALAEPGPWRERIRGVRANASTRSHAELDAATELDIGDPADLARRYRALRGNLPRLSVFGGCCGTDHRHLGAICAACL
jgi:homocysteine S-methyltransferase